MWKSLQDPLLTLGIILRIMTYDRWIKSENVDEVELEIGQWSGITRGIPRIMQIQLATFPILMYLACRAKLEGILDSFEHISTVSVTSDLSRSSRFRFRSNFCNSKANDLEYLYADVRSSDEIDEKNQRGIGISVPIRRLEAVKYSKRSFENLKSKSKKPIEL